MLHSFSQDKILDPSAMASNAGMQSGFPSYAQMLKNDNGISYNGRITYLLLHD